MTKETRIDKPKSVKTPENGVSDGRERSNAQGRENLLRFRKDPRSAAVKHGVRSLIRTGELPDIPGADEVAASADAIVGEMVSDLGGGSELSAQQRAIVESQRMCLLVLGLANNFIRREGLLSKRGKPHALLHTVVSFANTLRLNAVTLGLERRARKIGPATLTEYLESRESEAKAEAPTEAETVIETEERE